MYQIKELRQRKAELLAENRALLATAQEAKRDHSEEEARRFDGNVEAIEKVTGDIGRVESLMDEERRTGIHRGYDPDRSALDPLPGNIAGKHGTAHLHCQELGVTVKVRSTPYPTSRCRNASVLPLNSATLS